MFFSRDDERSWDAFFSVLDVLIFYFNEANFLEFSHRFWVSLEIALNFFWLNRTAEKRLHFRDLSVAKMMKKQLKSWIVGKSANRKNYWVILFLCTVKNNCQKFVEFTLRKSNFFVHTDVHVGNLLNFTVQKNLSFFMQISEDPVKPSKFPTWTKKYWFSQCEIHKLPTIIFHSVEEEFLEN